MKNNHDTIYIALLRGINVSGKNLIKMDSLANNLIHLGFTSVQTYIQSGNLVFKSMNSNAADLEKIIHDLIAEKYSLNIPVLVKSISYWNKVLHENPYLQQENIQTEFLHLTLLDALPDPFRLGSIEPISNLNDTGIIIEDRVYIFCPGGYGNTKLSNTYFESKLKVKATTRNWKTVIKLSEIANSLL